MKNQINHYKYLFLLIFMVGCGRMRDPQALPTAPVLAAKQSNPTLSLSNSGGGKVTATGLDCGSTCSASFPADSRVLLNVEADDGWQFDGFGGACSGAGTQCEVLMFQDQFVSVRFSQKAVETGSGESGNSGGTGSSPPADPFPKLEFTVSDARIDEASGLARSQINAGLLWTHNDSGGATKLFAINQEGKYRGEVEITGSTNLDWEDMVSFVDNGKPYLLVADMGDNNAFRPQMVFYVIEEPSIDHLPDGFSIAATPAWTMTATYPDGPRDAEGLAVSGGLLWILSKRDAPNYLYTLNLKPPASGSNTAPANAPQVLSKVAKVETLPATDMPTAMDFSADGKQALVVMYNDSYLFQRQGTESWDKTFARAPKRLNMPLLKQAEGGAFSGDGSKAFVISEQLPAKLVQVSLP